MTRPVRATSGRTHVIVVTRSDWFGEDEASGRDFPAPFCKKCGVVRPILDFMWREAQRKDLPPHLREFQVLQPDFENCYRHCGVDGQPDDTIVDDTSHRKLKLRMDFLQPNSTRYRYRDRKDHKQRVFITRPTRLMQPRRDGVREIRFQPYADRSHRWDGTAYGRTAY